ncbi:MAG: metallophosphoesterase [Oscillospiraceae bacterium]|nr:metallophosphoesterase [Oscillospiraceae bacterium]
MKKTELAFIADIHYYSPRLGDKGRAYELRSGSDQKCLAESGAVVDAALKKIKNSSVDALVISGDVSNNGERFSHEEIYAKLRAFSEQKPVYLITSTHDWCTNHSPSRYEGDKVYNDVEALGAEELDALYKDFGRDKLIAEFETSRGFHSRCYQINEEVRLLCVNDDADGAGGKSGYSEEHLNWMVEQITKAKEAGNYIIATEHHLMLYNVSGLINKGQSIADNYEVAARLADAGLRLMFVGHSHFQRTTEFVSPAGNKITQVNIGSLCGYPAPINYVTIENGVAHIRVEFLDGFDYNGKHYDARFFKDHSADVLLNILNAAATDKQELKDRLGAHGIRIKPLDKIYFIIRRLAKTVLGITVGRAGRLVNFFTFGKGVNRKAVKAHKKEKLLPYVISIFLCLFDGSYIASSLPETVKTIVGDVGTLPGRVVSKLPIKKAKKEKIYKTTNEIEGIVRELVYPAAPDNTECSVLL